MKKNILILVGLFAAAALVGCGSATVKVTNSSSEEIENITIGAVVFSDLLYQGDSTDAVTISADTYYPTFNIHYDPSGLDPEGWYFRTASDPFVVTSGLFTINENVWTFDDYTYFYS